MNRPPRFVLFLLFTVLCLFSNARRGTAAEPGRAMKVGETDTYVVRIGPSKDPWVSKHLSLKCVAKYQKGGKWYVTCISRGAEKAPKRVHIPLRKDGCLDLEDATFAMNVKKVKGAHVVRRDRFRVSFAGMEPVGQADRTVLGHVYKNCLYYCHEKRYKEGKAIAEQWKEPHVGVVEARERFRYSKGGDFEVRLMLESIRRPGGHEE